MKLESGPAKADSIWQAVRAVIFLAFAVWFFKDATIGYPGRNRAAAEQALQVRPFDGKVRFEALPEAPDKPDFERLQKLKPSDREQVRQLLGAPTFTDSSNEHFISRYGYIQVPLKGSLNPADIIWKKWDKTKEEIWVQYLCAAIAALPALYFLWRLYKAVTLRVTIDDAGMLYAGRRIAFDSMIALRDYSPKGWIDLHYRAGAEERKLRLDNEKVARFDQIVAAVCEAKGFKNEVTAYAERKAREAAEEEQAAADDPNKQG